MPEISETPSAWSAAITIAAPPRMSSASTGAAESASTPRITAWWPSVRMSAPILLSSSTYRNRASKTFSVAIDVPSAVARSAIMIGWKSVASPG